MAIIDKKPFFSRDCLRMIVWEAIWLTLIWWALTEGDLSSWLFGIPFIIIAIALSWHFQLYIPLSPLNLVALIHFIIFFLWRSIIGGVDVTQRVLQPTIPINPGWIDYSLEDVPDDLARWLFICAISLLPGTLSSELKGDNKLVIHTLSDDDHSLQELKMLEQRITRIFQ